MSSGSKSHLGKVAYIDRDYDYAFGGFMGLIKPKTNILPRYLFYLLQTPEYKELIKKLSNGININNIKFSDLKEFQFELPSLEEQGKILNTLDKADEIRAKKKLANDKLDEFLKSTFIDMFGDVENNSNQYLLKTIKEICKVKGGKRIPKGMSYTTEKTIHPYIRVKDMRNYSVSKKELIYLEDNVYNSIRNYTVNFGDIYMTIAGTTGIVGTIPKELNNANLTENAVKLELLDNTYINNIYLSRYLDSKYIQKIIKSKTMSVGVPKLAIFRIEEIPVLIPPIEQQNKFAEIVEKVEQQKKKNEEVIEQMDNLFNSLSKKAFKGEL